MEGVGGPGPWRGVMAGGDADVDLPWFPCAALSRLMWRLCFFFLAAANRMMGVLGGASCCDGGGKGVLIASLHVLLSLFSGWFQE
jgi:hypothetical protein